jgi:cytochrome c oxidase subunit 1
MIPVPSGTPLRLARTWLWLGLIALIGSGLLAILLVFSRTPGIQDVFPLREFFRSALIVHVDLSVAVWFMAFASVLWSAAGNARGDLLGRVAFWLACGGTVLMTLSPFFPDAHPLLNNYIPVLRQPVFFASLWLCAAGFGLSVLRALATSWPEKSLLDPLRVGVFLAAVAGAVAFVAFIWSWLTVPTDDSQSYYEMVFWGGGHVLQYQHALLMAVAWLWIADHLGAKPVVTPRVLSVLFIVSTLPLLAVPVIYLGWAADSALHMAYFAKLMEWGHTYMGPVILIALIGLWRLRGVAHPAKSAFVASFVLFGAGGILGYMIRGVNVVIPAHYHGAIVGVTLAFMGLTYVLLPQLGFRAVEGRMARWQAYIYGFGQLMHILGLAWSGGYGVQRKVAGAEQMLTTLPQKIGMGMMGLGGLIAIIGGLLFVVVCLKSMWPRKTA